MSVKIIRVRTADFISDILATRGEALAASAAKARAERLADAYRRAAVEMASEMRPEKARQRAEWQRQRRNEFEALKLEKARRGCVAAFNNAEAVAWSAKAPKVKE